MSEREHAPGAESPRRVGRYLLYETLGAGGMGEVHRARAFAAAGVVKDLCIKRIRAERLSHPGAVERFIAEARLSVQLAHGNIVPVFDFGRAGDEYFLAMEWVDGADLRMILAQAAEDGAALAPAIAAHVAAEVARALSYAHALGGKDGSRVVHGDIKPANVLISRSGDVKLTDFGVATAMGGAGAGGTPAYMAPEQERGDPIDGRADLFALGVVLVEMLTLERPKRTKQGMKWREEDVPSELRSLVARLLATSPGDRPSSARDVAVELESFVGRARAAGGASPRDVLADAAVRGAEQRAIAREEVELGADASFLRDGIDELTSRMLVTGTMTTFDASESESAAPRKPERASPTAPPEPRSIRARTVAFGVLIAAMVVAIAVVVTQGGPDGERGAGGAGATSATERAAPTELAPQPAPPPVEPASRPEEPAPSATSTSSSVEPPAIVPAEPVAPPAATRTSRRATRTTARAPEAATPEAEPATLNVNAIPWAEVRLDGRPIGVTPLFGVRVPPGAHVLRFENRPLGADRETSVDVSSGERRDVVVDLR